MAYTLSLNTPQFGDEYDGFKMRQLVEELERLHTELVAETTATGVQEFNGRTGEVVPLQADYDAFFLTQAEGDARYYTQAQVDALVAFDLVDDTTPQLGGNLASNGNNILMADNDSIIFGTGSDATLLFNATNSVWNQVNGEFILQRAASASLQTQQYNGSGNTSAMQVRSHDNVLYDVGYNLLPQFNFNATDTLEAQHCGHVTGKDNTTATYVLTGPASSDEDFPVNGVAHVWNLGASGIYTLNDTATCTMFWCSGSAAPVDIAGAGTLAAGGMITLWRKSTTEIYIMGTGFTP